jgi:adenylate cyclase
MSERILTAPLLGLPDLAMTNLVLGTETERKFLVRDGWPRQAPARLIRQGYFPTVSGITMRVRWTRRLGLITIKTPVVAGTRWEAEYPISPYRATELLAQCPHQPIEKLRHQWHEDGVNWEIDEFLGRHAGLCMAEVELLHPWQEVPRPAWLGEEVTREKAFHNSTIARTASLMEVLAMWSKVKVRPTEKKSAALKGGSRAADILPASALPGRMHFGSRFGGILHRGHSL